MPYYAKNGRVGPAAHGRYLFFATAASARSACAVLNSSLFYLYFLGHGDCFHLSDTLATGFPVEPSILEDQHLIALSDELMTDVRRNATRRTIQTKDGDAISYDEFRVSQSKSIIDQIDTVLAEQ